MLKCTHWTDPGILKQFINLQFVLKFISQTNIQTIQTCLNQVWTPGTGLQDREILITFSLLYSELFPFHTQLFIDIPSY